MPFFVAATPALPGFVFEPPFDRRQPDRLPAKARQADRKPLGDVMLATGDLDLVSGRFRAAVEALEPGVHAFHPLSVGDADGAPREDDWFVFRCGQAFGAVLSKKSGFDGAWQTTVHGRPHRGLSTARTDGVVLSAPEIAGRHLFGNLFHGPAMLVFSDELMRRLAPLDLRYLATYPVEAVDEPWDAEKEIGPWLDWVGGHEDWLRANQPLTATEVIAIHDRYRPPREN